MTLPIPPTNGTKYDFAIKAVRDLGFPIVIAAVLLYSVLYQIPRNETAINNARNALVALDAKVNACINGAAYQPPPPPPPPQP